MKKLFGLFLLALVYIFAPAVANATPLFAVCTATPCTWDNTSTAMWSLASGGATGAGPPGAGDDVIFDNATCVGGTTCTTNTFNGTITINTLTFGTCTASTTGCIIDASVNTTNFNVASTISGTGTGTRVLRMGAGTWTLTGNTGLWNFITSTNLTLTKGTSTISFTGSGGTAFRRFLSTGLSYNAVSITGSTNNAFIFAGNTNTLASLTIGVPNRLQFGNGTTTTITNPVNTTGSAASGQQIAIETDDVTGGQATISSANNWTCTYCAFKFMVFTGGGTFTGANSFDLGNNSGIAITAPSGGGSSGRIIGG